MSVTEFSVRYERIIKNIEVNHTIHKYLYNDFQNDSQFDWIEYTFKMLFFAYDQYFYCNLFSSTEIYINVIVQILHEDIKKLKYLKQNCKQISLNSMLSQCSTGYFVETMYYFGFFKTLFRKKIF